MGGGTGRLLSLLGLLSLCWARLPELECPEDCDCHYFRINWVTDCSETNLTAVPTLEEGLSLNVYVLNLNGNNLTEIEPFPEDIKLRSLKLADNQLTKVTRVEFAGLGYLLDLDLSGNQITHVESDSFSDSPGLITLELQSNPLEEVTGPFLITRSLLNLDLSSCSLRNLNQNFFTDVPHLNSLDLSRNSFQELTPGVFDPLISLQELKLNACNLTNIDGSLFAKLQDLKKLELSGNNLYNPMDWAAVLTPLIRLEYLDISRSHIRTLPDDVFENNQWLRSLILANNQLIDLDVATTLGQNLKHLDFLDLSNCNIIGPLSEGAFANATKLRTLYLTGNAMSATDLAVALFPLTKLQKLSLRNCTLTRLPPNTFEKFPNLKELDISHNPLNDAFTSLLNPLSNLIHLDMGFSNLGSISKSTFHKMKSLKTLILSGNPLQSLESGLFKNLTHLETLELKNCGLSRLNGSVFHQSSNYPDLTELNLAGNPLEIPLKGSFLPRQLTRLKKLNLSDCGVSYIPANALHSFGNITELYLSNNKLRFRDQGEFEFLNNLPDLEKLDMSYNNITSISPVVFRNNQNLTWVKLVGNPWKCACYVADMWEWAEVVKGDLSILVGSTVSSEEIIRTNPKKRNTLYCRFDHRSSPVKHVTSRRQKYITAANRTWARYVRESACDSGQRVLPTKLLPSPQALEAVRVETESPTIPTWAWSTSIAVISALLIAGAVFIVFLTKPKNKRTPTVNEEGAQNQIASQGRKSS
uniref:Leucine-rich repeat-containing protein 15 n=1 Tax=Lygus hesperus TaxID=30085 RepID=A0A146KNW1_LYGHE